MPKNELLDSLNPEQLKAVTHQSGPLLIVAGAGTGKTMVLTRRFVHLTQSQHLNSDNILALTFTEKAAGEMEDRILQLLPSGAYDLWVHTFHGFCERVLSRYGLEIGLPNSFRLLNETDAWLLLKRRIEELPLDHYRPLGNPVKFLSELQKHISRAKDEGITPEKYYEFAESAILDGDSEFVSGERARLKELASCYVAYEKILHDEGALDFGDLILETLRLLRTRPHVLRDIREQFKHVLVDEFQDTNWAQYELVKLLSDPTKNLTVVGDDDQSIYKFRGASLANILQFRDDYPTAETVMLSINYRSNQEILDAAYSSIICNNPNRLEIKLADLGLNKRLTANRGQGGIVETRWYPSIDEEAEAVVNDIIAAKSADASLTWNDFAILSRSNDGAEPFVRALDHAGLPFRFYALSGLYSKPIIVDITSVLSLLDGYRESAAVWRALTSESQNFPMREIAAYLAYANRRGLGLFETLEFAPIIQDIKSVPEAVNRAKHFVSIIENLTETARREPPLKVFQQVIEQLEILKHVLTLPEREKTESIDLLNSFAARIKRYEQSVHGPTLRGFLEELKLELSSGETGALRNDPDAGPELIKVMTIHASKGLEFRNVYLISMVDARFPSRTRVDAIPLPEGLINERLQGDAHLEEERRLFYVAVTRARNKLMLTGADNYGGVRAKKPSAFLGELGVELVKIENQSREMEIIAAPRRVLPEEREFFKLKRRFSFTQLAAFRSCPLQYKFAHIYRIPILGSFHKSFGNSIHNCLKQILTLHLGRGKAVQGDLFSAPQAPMVSNSFRVELDEALSIFEDCWIDEWYPDRGRHDEYKKEGSHAIKRFMDEWSKAPPDVSLIEQPFEWRLGEDLSIKGAVDRIDKLPDGGCMIMDYKTGEPKSDEDLDRGAKEQLWIYQIAMQERGLDIRRLAFNYIRGAGIVEVDLLQGAKLDAFKTDISERMRAILTSDFNPAPSPFVCKYCDFYNICEFRK